MNTNNAFTLQESSEESYCNKAEVNTDLPPIHMAQSLINQHPGV